MVFIKSVPFNPLTTNQPTTDHLLTDRQTDRPTDPPTHHPTDPNDTFLFQRLDN